MARQDAGRKAVHSPSRKGWLTFHDSQLGYQLDYPVSWKAQKINEALVKANLNKDNTSGLQIRIHPVFSEVFDEPKAGRMSNSYIQSMTGHRGGHMEVVFEGLKRLGKRDIYTFYYDFQRADHQRWFLAHYLFQDPKGRIFQLQGGSKWEDRGAIEPLLEGMVGSLEVDEVP